MSVRRFSIRSGSRIDQIQLELASDIQSKFLPQHGENGGGSYDFKVQEGELITQIEVRSGQYVDSLTFITNKGTRSKKFGGNGGNYFLVNAPTDGQLIGIKGISAGILDLIGFIWMIPKYGYETN